MAEPLQVPLLEDASEDAGDTLPESEQFFRLAWEHALDGMRLTDAEGVVRRVNAAYCRMVGKPKEELEGQSLAIIYPPERRLEVLERYRWQFAAKTTPPHTQVQALLWNGREAHFEHSNCFLERPAGPLLLSVVRDVSDWHRAEQERLRLLHEQAELADHLGLLLEATAEGIYGVDLEGKCTFINRAAARMLGYAPGELLGKSIHEAAHDGAAEHCPLCPLGGEERRGYPGFRMRRRDGSAFPADYSAAPVVRAGVCRGAVVRFLDASERLDLEEQLRRAQKLEAIGRLAGGIAHDFNNLLTVIIGYSDLIHATLPADSPLRQSVEMSKRAAERGAALTRQLLVFSRRQVVPPRVLDLNAVLTDTQTLLHRLIGSDVAFVLRPAAEPALVKADAGQLQQVLLNLCVNARDAMPTGGTLTIASSTIELDTFDTQGRVGLRPGPYVLLEVSDTGVGMSAEVQARIFEPFFTTKEVGKGTGLGLSIVYGIVEQAGGHIEVTSAPGRGTTFRLYFPQAQGAPPVSALTETSAAASRRAGSAATVLVAEDEDMVRGLIRMALRWNGYAVLEARNGTEALAVVEGHPGPIHLLITDVVMPGLTGPDLARRLQAIRPKTKVLYVSGYTGEDEPTASLEPGAVLLGKPFTPDDLLGKVKEMLEG
jgi:PAS domain S-box-containing protein